MKVINRSKDGKQIDLSQVTLSEQLSKEIKELMKC